MRTVNWKKEKRKKRWRMKYQSTEAKEWLFFVCFSPLFFFFFFSLSFSFFFALSLFLSFHSHSTLESELPYRGHILLEKKDNTEQFKFIAKQLRELNIDFFEKKAELKRGFLFEVVISYNFEQSLGNSIDLGCYPFFKNVKMSELCRDQQRYLRSQGRDVSREPSKLISTHQNRRTVVDFVDNILFLLCFQSCYIEDILSIITFETNAFMKEYIQSLQNERAKATSPLMSKIIKNLGNW